MAPIDGVIQIHGDITKVSRSVYPAWVMNPLVLKYYNIFQSVDSKVVATLVYVKKSDVRIR